MIISELNLFSVPQAPVRPHRRFGDVRRSPPGGCGREADLRQVPGEERWPQGIIRQRTSGSLLPREVLGGSQHQYPGRGRGFLRSDEPVSNEAIPPDDGNASGNYVIKYRPHLHVMMYRLILRGSFREIWF